MTPFFDRRFCLAQVGVSLALALGACSTYQAPGLPDGQLATLGIAATDYNLKFISVDGAYLSSVGRLNSFAGRSELKLSPGKHAVELDYLYLHNNMNQQRGTSTLVFEAQAGRRYTVHERTEGHKFYAWITTEGGERVTLLPKESK
jgi:hypothetical protein